MPRAIRRCPIPDEEGSEEENEPRLAFSGKPVPYFQQFFEFYPEKGGSLSHSGSSVRFQSGTSFKNDELVAVRRKDASSKNQNPFVKYNMPDLAIEAIFVFLRKRDLCSAMLSCRRFYEVGKACPSWRVTDAADRPVSELSLAALMLRNIRVLRLSGARPLPDPRLPNRHFESALCVSARLEVLDLSRANLSFRQLLIVLKPCRLLRFLSLEGNELNDDVARCVSDNIELRELDLSMTTGLTEVGVFNIFHNCQKLDALNVSWCGMTTGMLHVLFEHLTPKIQKLNVSGSVRHNGIIDEQVHMLASACPNIRDLDLSDNVQLESGTIFSIIEHLYCIHTLSINRCYGIDPNIIVHLNQFKPLKNLNCHGCITDANMEMFLEICNRLVCNRQFFNYTAKPNSNPSSNSQIWGRRVAENH